MTAKRKARVAHVWVVEGDSTDGWSAHANVKTFITRSAARQEIARICCEHGFMHRPFYRVRKYVRSTP